MGDPGIEADLQAPVSLEHRQSSLAAPLHVYMIWFSPARSLNRPKLGELSQVRWALLLQAKTSYKRLTAPHSNSANEPMTAAKLFTRHS